MLGMVLSVNDVQKVLVPTNKPPDISYNGQGFQFDLTLTPDDATAFTLNDQRAGKMPTTVGPDTINRTLELVSEGVEI